LSSSSTNKQPLLVDRPLHAFATLGDTAALTSSSNYNTVLGAGCRLLVDCSSNDGALVDSISIIATEASTTASAVLVFLSTASSSAGITSSNTVLVASGAIASASAGQRTNIALPPLAVPVPNLASPAATMAAYPTETDKKNTGLMVPSGALIYVGLNAVLSAPSAATRVHVLAQGGFY
jgi:hypothetical protein